MSFKAKRIVLAYKIFYSKQNIIFMILGKFGLSSDVHTKKPETYASRGIGWILQFGESTTVDNECNHCINYRKFWIVLSLNSSLIVDLFFIQFVVIFLEDDSVFIFLEGGTISILGFWGASQCNTPLSCQKFTKSNSLFSKTCKIFWENLLLSIFFT